VGYYIVLLLKRMMEGIDWTSKWIEARTIGI